MSTYVPIQTLTLTGTTAQVTFSSIPQNFTDLVFHIAAQDNRTGGNDCQARFNNDSTNSYTETTLSGNGTSPASGTSGPRDIVNFGPNGASNLGTYSSVQAFINGYANSTTHKTLISRWSQSTVVGMVVGRYAKTDPITRVDFYAGSGYSFTSGTTFTLYGVGSGSPKAFGGDIVTTDGTYWYHTFNTSGVFTPVQELTCDFLVIAGGGGGAAISSGGAYGAPGGGAGGYRTSVGTSGRNSSPESPLTLTAANYAVIVGAGGASNTLGSNSVFSTITSLGGGSMVGGTSVNGGSGGGAFDFAPQNVPGAGTANQGFGGGTAASATSPGGGGGAGGAGSSARQGGVGITSSISGSSVGRAGGGGGGYTSSTNATDGGGSGGFATSNNGSNATANTGGGGGGGAANGTTTSGGSGGSGVVIVRYAV